jgi:hypothetical protein
MSIRFTIQKWVQKKPFPITLLNFTFFVLNEGPRVYEEEESEWKTPTKKAVLPL